MPILPFPQLILGSGQCLTSTGHPQEIVSLPVNQLMHTICTGKSGYGKSRFLCALAVMLFSRGVSFTLLDPAGDLGRLVLRQLISLGYFDAHPDPFSQLLYLDMPAAHRQGLYLPMNVLATSHDPYTTADLVLEAFKRAFPALKSGTATTIEMMVKLASFVLAANRVPLMPGMYYLLTDTAYRTSLLQHISDDLVVRFFQEHTNPRGELDLGIDPTVKRLFLLCFAPLLRYSLGQRDNVLDFRHILDQQQSVIINLNLPDPDALRLLGCLITVQAETGAKARGELPPDKRHGTHVLIVDEFPAFSAQSGEALSQILDQCRKMGLYLCLAHQSWSQVPHQLRGALHNCDIRLAFRLERPDAEESASLLGFPIDPLLLKPTSTTSPRYYSSAEQRELHIQAITQLAKREAFVKLPGDRLYKLACLDVPDVVVEPARLAAVEAEYQRRYFRPPSAIEAATTHQRACAVPSASPGTVQQREAL